jgi:hypothetical protein
MELAENLSGAAAEVNLSLALKPSCLQIAATFDLVENNLHLPDIKKTSQGIFPPLPLLDRVEATSWPGRR